MENYSLSDIAAASGGEGMAGGGFFWIFALLILLGMGNGGLWGGNSALQQGDLQRAIDLNSIQNGQRDIEARVQEIGAENISAIKDAAYNNLSEIRDNGALINAGFANLQNCCCDMKQTVMENRYLASQNTAEINANTTAQVQKVLDAISTNRMADMQNQINSLQMQLATNTTVKYPTTSAWAMNGNPFCGCNCTGY